MKDSFTVELDPEVSQRLNRLAVATERSKTVLVEEAIKEYLGLQEWQMQAIKQAIQQDDAGQLIPHDEIKHRVEGWE